MPIRFTPTQVLADLWALGLVAFVVALILTPLVRWVAYRRGIVDRPDAELKPHGRSVAYMGGVAVCGGFLAAMIVRYTAKPEIWARIWPLALPVLLATIIITLTGLLDDIYKLRPRQKVAGQLLAAGVLFVGLVHADIHLSAADILVRPVGLYVPSAHPPKPPTLASGAATATTPDQAAPAAASSAPASTEWRLPVPAWLAAVISAALTVAVVISACNATNLLDGLDGLCGGVTGIIALGFVALTVYLACYGRYVDEGTDKFRVLLCLAVAGAVLGFLPYNIPPASVFLGDAGSMLLGFFVATMMMLFAREGTIRWFLAACVIFALPIADTGLAVVRRALAGKSIFAGDRGHLYDQLVDRGMTIKGVVGLFYVLAILAAALGALQAIYLRLRYAVILDGVIVAVVLVIFAGKRMILPPPREGKGPGAGD